ncbi:hypothetical protein GCM10017643_37430 [Ancylobacter dichloromethanicus]|uniref:Methylenetetrahydrofolate reductase n=1 Tax=Ancylobacter dichloromethanicus TaxID=518825 RepID=A0A9W6JD49_9HYPH|nr:hypothetical protein GCM10017643_37430 [Ancylobacter dichloromethanicus]
MQAAKALRREDLVPVPHVTARTLKDAAQLADRLKRLSDECGVDEILLLAGGDARATGAFQNTLEILGTGVLERSGLARIGFAGHPEGHSDVSGSDLEKALQAKNEFARASGIACYLVTQFFFDAAPVLAWERGLRALGIQLPVHPGIHGLAGVPSLIRHAVACGVGASLKALRSSSPGLLQLAGRRDPSGLVSAIVEARASDPDSLFEQLHFFPLGAFERTVEYANALPAQIGRSVLTAES